MATTIELVLSVVGILLAAALFTNSIEMLGDRMNLGQGAVGSVLAAVGTALPETMIPIVAILGALILGGDPAASGEIGVGAILGAPFLLATLAAFVIGAAAIGYKGRRETGTRLDVDQETVRRDMVFFFICFAVAAGVGVAGSFFAVPLWAKVAVAVGLVAAYVVHVVQTIRAGGDALEEVPDDLTLWPESRFGEAPTWAVVVQVVGSLAVMALGAHYFVEAVRSGSESLGIPAGLIALVLAPLATELPEKFNSVIWLRDNKDTLAIGNITGAMVFQSTVPVSLGLAFTPWSLDALNALSAVLALVGGAIIIAMLLSKGGGVLYAIFLGAAIYQLAL